MPNIPHEIAFGLEVSSYDVEEISAWIRDSLEGEFRELLPSRLGLVDSQLEVSLTAIRGSRSRTVKRNEFETILREERPPFTLFMNFIAQDRNVRVQRTVVHGSEESLVVTSSVHVVDRDASNWVGLIEAASALARALASTGQARGALLIGPEGSGQFAQVAGRPGIAEQSGFEVLETFGEEDDTEAAAEDALHREAAVAKISTSTNTAPSSKLVAAVQAQSSDVRVARSDREPPLYSAFFDVGEIHLRAETLRAQVDETHFWPFMVDGSDCDEEMPQLLWRTTDLLGPAVVQAALEVDVERGLLDKALELSPMGRQSEGSSSEGEMQLSLTGDLDPLDFLLFVPASSGWEALAQLGFEEANSGFSASEHTAVARWLFSKVGAVPVVVGVDRITYQFPPMNRASVAPLIAAVMMNYCPDLNQVTTEPQLTSELSRSGKGLLGLWWD